MKTPDAIEILVRNQAKALIEHGVSPEDAQAEAEERVAQVLAELDHLGLSGTYVGVALRRARVFQLRSQGLTVRVVALRCGVCPNTVIADYSHEMLRRRETCRNQPAEA